MSSWSQAGCHPSAACLALLPMPARLLPSQPGHPEMCVHCQTAITRTHRMRCPPPLGRQCRSCSHRCWCCLRCWMRRAGMTGRRNPSSRCWQGTLQSQRRGPTCRAGVKLAATRRQLAQRSCPSLTAPAVAAVWPAGAHAPHESYTTSWPPMSQLQSSLLVLPVLLDAPSGQDWQPSSMK